MSAATASVSSAPQCYSARRRPALLVKNAAKDFYKLPHELQNKVDSIYTTNGFVPGFRLAINSKIAGNIDWPSYETNTLQSQLSQFISKDMPEFKPMFKQKESSFTKMFKQSIETELSICNSMEAAVNRKRSTPNTVELEQSSYPTVAAVRAGMDTLTSSRNKVVEQVFGSQRTASNHKVLLKTVLQVAASNAKQVMVMFRRCMDECRLHQLRSALTANDQGESKETRALDNELNHVEVHAQTYVRLMYDFMAYSAGVTEYVNYFHTCIYEVTRTVLFVSRLSEQQTIKDDVTFSASLRLFTLPALRQLKSDNLQESVTVTYAMVNELDAQQYVNTNKQPVEVARFTHTPGRNKSKNSKLYEEKWTQLQYVTCDEYGRTIGQVVLAVNYMKIKANKQLGNDYESDDDADDDDEDETPAKSTRTNGALETKKTFKTENKAALVLTVHIPFANGTTWTVCTNSYAVILIKNSKQIVAAWRTLFWHDAFYCPGQPMPTEVSWQAFIDALQKWFTNKTARPLCTEHEQFVQNCVCVDGKVKYDALWKKADLQKRPRCPINMKFWLFFYRCTKALVDVEELGQLWRDGQLYGFVSHDDAIKRVVKSPGKPLIRFSNKRKELAIVITLSFVNPRDESQVYVCTLEPIKIKKKSLVGVQSLRCELLNLEQDINCLCSLEHNDAEQKLSNQLFHCGVEDVCGVVTSMDSENTMSETQNSRVEKSKTEYVQTGIKLKLPHISKWKSYEACVSFDEIDNISDDEDGVENIKDLFEAEGDVDVNLLSLA